SGGERPLWALAQRANGSLTPLAQAQREDRTGLFALCPLLFARRNGALQRQHRFARREIEERVRAASEEIHLWIGLSLVRFEGERQPGEGGARLLLGSRVAARWSLACPRGRERAGGPHVEEARYHEQQRANEIRTPVVLHAQCSLATTKAQHPAGR